MASHLAEDADTSGEIDQVNNLVEQMEKILSTKNARISMPRFSNSDDPHMNNWKLKYTKILGPIIRTCQTKIGH